MQSAARCSRWHGSPLSHMANINFYVFRPQPGPRCFFVHIPRSLKGRSRGLHTFSPMSPFGPSSPMSPCWRQRGCVSDSEAGMDLKSVCVKQWGEVDVHVSPTPEPWMRHMQTQHDDNTPCVFPLGAGCSYAVFMWETTQPQLQCGEEI